MKDAVFVDDALHLRPVGLWRNLDAAGALHRLAGKGGDVLRSDGQDLVLERARGAKAEIFRRLAFEGLAVPIGIHDVAEALIDRVAVQMHMRHAAHRGCGDGRAVIGVLARDDDTPLRLALERPVMTDQADRGVVRFRPRRAVEHLVEVVWRNLGELARQLDDRRVRGAEEGVVERQLEHLLVGRLGKLACGYGRHSPSTAQTCRRECACPRCPKDKVRRRGR